MTTPAERVIQKFGGHAKLAALLGINVTRVYRWTYPTGKRGGSGGTIPQRHHVRLLELARDNHVKLRLADFYPPMNGKATQQQAAE